LEKGLYSQKWNMIYMGLRGILKKGKQMNRIGWTKKKATIALTLCVIIAVSSIMFLQNSQTTQAALIIPHPPGLVGWWSFNEGSGTVAGDSSGNGNSGTISGATWVAGKYGDALSFNGGGYVTVPDTVSLQPTAITVTCWVNGASLQNTGYVGKYYDYILYSEGGGQPAFIVWNGGGAGSAAYSAIALPLNQWVFIVGTFGADGIARIYVNGVLQGSGSAITPNIRDGGAPLYVGKRGDGIGSSFPGAIDEVRIYNRALSAADIQTDFQQGPDFSSNVLVKVPQGTTQVITTLSWQGTTSINATIVSPSQTYTESMIPMYQKTTYSTSEGISSMLNIKRLSVSVNALPSDQNWNVTLTFDNPVPYQITVEVQK
jgi:hypothetical protein